MPPNNTQAQQTLPIYTTPAPQPCSATHHRYPITNNLIRGPPPTHTVLFRLHREMHRALSLLPRNKKKNGEGKQKPEKSRKWEHLTLCYTSRTWVQVFHTELIRSINKQWTTQLILCFWHIQLRAANIPCLLHYHNPTSNRNSRSCCAQRT
jgi:hypothetical protein